MVSLKIAWPTQQVSGQPGPHRETPSTNKQTTPIQTISSRLGDAAGAPWLNIHMKFSSLHPLRGSLDQLNCCSPDFYL